MTSTGWQMIQKRQSDLSLFNLVVFAFFLCIISLAILTNQLWLVFIPSFIVLAIIFLQHPKWIYFLLIFSIPLSIELPIGSLSLDVPDELLNIFFFLLTPGLLIINYKRWDLGFIRHPIVISLLAMFAISILATVFSINQLLSLKYVLAKAWYLVAYFACTAFFIGSMKDLKTLAWCAVIGCTITILYVLVRHASVGFSFTDVNFFMAPFYSNHVNYAVQILVIFPFLWLIWRERSLNHRKARVLIAWMGLFVIAIWFSYTRAAILTLLLSVGFYFVVRWKLMKPVFWLSVICIILGTLYYVNKNKFFELAPDYNKVITQHQFNSLITATYNLEDISTMERVYRWVAARYMIPEKPLLGVGPNNFYDTYKSFTVKSFRTYVSDNPEKSTVHSYILLLAIEQGVPAALLYIILVYFAFMTVQRVYHNTHSRHIRIAILAAGICFFNLVMVLMINDVVESDKEGSFFYISLALIAAIHYREFKQRWPKADKAEVQNH